MAVAITQTANPAGVTASGAVTTYSGVSIGTESGDRVVVVLVGKENATINPSDATLDGVAMTNVALSTFGSMGTNIFWLPKATGTTADVAVTWSNSGITNVENHIAVYAVTDAAFPLPLSSGTDTSTDMDATDPLTTGSITIPTNGGVLIVAVGATDTVAKTWSTGGDIDADVGNFRFMTAKSTTGGAATITCTGGTNNEDGALSWIMFTQQRIPAICMAPSRL